ncbi:MAG: DNA alkylation repair protein [Brachyspira sp.]|nr:DNA alkylation repair protein [Brachyspira sp.]
MSIIKEVRNQILQEADEKYQTFSSALLPGVNNVVGVRLPVLRKISREIYKSDWQTYLKNNDCRFMEETMLKGMVIGLIKDEPEKILNYIENFVPEINNWSVCDSFCCGLKFIKKNKELVWNFVQKYLNSEKEFEIRFGVVVLLNYFIEENYIDRVLEKLEKVKTTDYYAQMAAAWAISICYIKFEAKTLDFLKKPSIDKAVFNKSIQKIIESNRISKETKIMLKAIKNTK